VLKSPDLRGLNESPGSPLSYFNSFRGLSSVGQKTGRGRGKKITKMRKSLKVKPSTRMKGKIAKMT
jgi:hypothetical protein